MSVRSAPCICGTRVVVIVGAEEQGVRAHNATRPHQVWRQWGGMEREVHGVEQQRSLTRQEERELVHR